MKYARPITALLLSVVASAPAHAFDFSNLFPPPEVHVISDAVVWAERCTPLHAFLGLNTELCAEIGDRMIEDELDDLAAQGLLREDLEHLTDRVSGRPEGQRLLNRAGHVTVLPTLTGEHLIERSYDGYDDIYSCREYVYKRFQQVRDFQIDVAANAMDGMGIAELAFAPGGLGATLADGVSLRGRNGQIFLNDQPNYARHLTPLVFRDYGSYATAPRSDFYDLTDEEIAAAVAYSDLRAEDLRAGREGDYTYDRAAGWALHADRYAALADVPHGTLRYFYEKRVAFQRHLSARQAQVDTLLFYVPEADTTRIGAIPGTTVPGQTEGEAVAALEECIGPPVCVRGGHYDTCSYAFSNWRAENERTGRGRDCIEEHQNLEHVLKTNLDAANRTLAEGLLDAREMGCMDWTRRFYSPVGVCDWSPEDFFEDVAGIQTAAGDTLSARMQDEQNRCTERIDDPSLWYDFARGEGYRYFTDTRQALVDPQTPLRQRADGVFSASDVERYLTRMSNSDRVIIDAQGEFADELRRMPAERRPTLQATGSGGDSVSRSLDIPFVDSDFATLAAGYNYAYDVGVVDAVRVDGLVRNRGGDVFDRPADAYDEDNPLCRPHPHASAHFDAWVSGFDSSYDVLNVNFDGRVYQDADPEFLAYRSIVDLEVLGVDIAPAAADQNGRQRTHAEWNITTGQPSARRPVCVCPSRSAAPSPSR